MAVLTAAAVLCGLLAPVTAAAAPMATDVPAATETEKVKAVNEIEVGEATKEWRDANDMDFVFKVYDRIKPEDFPLTREESYRSATPIPAATWKIVPGLGDPNCFSLESSVKIGNYLRVAANLRVQLVGNDGSEAYKAAATWCAKPGLDGSANVSLESKAHPGRYLRQYWSELWAANGRANDQFDTGANFQTDATWKAIDPRPLSTTPIMFKYYNEDWWRNLLGSPIGPEEIQTGTTTPSRHRRFANGAAFSSARTTTVYNVLDPLFPKYSASFGRWVQPTTDSLFLPDGKGRCTTTETGVAIYWSPTTGAHMVYGAILGLWRTLDHERGWLGYPISDEKDVPGQPGMRRSEFQHGNIDHTPERGAWAYAVNR
jgi:hypothetical protein